MFSQTMEWRQAAEPAYIVDTLMFVYQLRDLIVIYIVFTFCLITYIGSCTQVGFPGRRLYSLINNLRT